MIKLGFNYKTLVFILYLKINMNIIKLKINTIKTLHLISKYVSIIIQLCKY